MPTTNTEMTIDIVTGLASEYFTAEAINLFNWLPRNTKTGFAT